MKAPFPYFGGKSRIAPVVWRYLGADVPNYVEPFAGSAAMLLKRPGWSPGVQWVETINDADGWVSNFWRAVRGDPEGVAHWADWPVNENDLHARHAWLRERTEDLRARLEGDPEYYDSKLAGWWVWGISCWIGGGWCAPGSNGPWTVTIDNAGVKRLERVAHSQGVHRKSVHLTGSGMGVHRRRVRLAEGLAPGRVHDWNAAGDGQEGLLNWMVALAERLRFVRVASGDWSRVCGYTPTITHGLTAVFLDPPYSDVADRDTDIYATDSLTVAHDVRRWCLEHGDDPKLRIVLCGYSGEHDDALQEAGWHTVAWKASGGYGNQGSGASRGKRNAHRERLWISPHCVREAEEAGEDGDRELFPMGANRLFDVPAQSC